MQANLVSVRGSMLPCNIEANKKRLNRRFGEVRDIKVTAREGEEKGKLGDDLRSQDVAIQVPSALAGLTAGFEKGPGVPPPLKTPRKVPSSVFPC